MMGEYPTILDRTSQEEMQAGSEFARIEREHPDVAEKATNLCKVLGLYGFWYRVNSARWEIAKVLLETESKVVSDQQILDEINKCYADGVSRIISINKVIDFNFKLDGKDRIQNSRIRSIAVQLGHYTIKYNELEGFAYLEKEDNDLPYLLG